MMLDHQIGQDPNNPEAPYIDGSDFARELLELDAMGKDSIEIWTATEGGSIMEGQKIYNAMLQAKTKVDTCCVGVTASMGAVIFCGGRHRTMMDWGQLMFHNPSGSEDKEMLAVMKDSLLKMTSRTGVSEDTFSEMFDKTTWMDAATAKSHGIATKVEYAKDLNKPRFAPMKARVNELQLITNNLITNIQMNKELALSLGLAEDATADEIKNAINALKTEKETAVSDLQKLKNKKVKKAEDGEVIEAKLEVITDPRIDALVATVNKLAQTVEANAKVATAKAEADAAALVVATAKANKEKAVSMVAKYSARIGKADDVVNSWVALAEKDYENTEKTLAALGVNRQSVKLDGVKNKTEDVGDTAPRIYNAAVLMSQIAARKKQIPSIN